MARPTTSTKKAGDSQPLRRWDHKTADLFIDHLIEHGNVTAAAAHIGFSREQCYNRRNADSAFAARWAEVIDTAKIHARETLLLNARAALEKAAENAVMSVRDIIAILKHHGPAGRTAPIVPLDPEAARAKLVEMVLAIKKGRAAA